MFIGGGVMWSVVKWYANQEVNIKLRGEGLARGVDEKGGLDEKGSVSG